MTKSRFSLFGQLWSFMRVNKKFWLLPMFLVLIAFGTLLVLVQGTVFAPFIYTVF